ncbi:histidine kinase [Siphonobacter sp. SORGH_AS_0500]|uniref:histidine kinase n=1 Tax=Siphonobacter sp. SORGH_AS_0500 TaxID=1864824 RepID=UPI0028599947|nr:histidine kinase [Siphonobacter sp. SORGH_AS_0500]MDR6197424.1 hypothetical protein [Siphonobacter sp. SORGH_AS_0500]
MIGLPRHQTVFIAQLSLLLLFFNFAKYIEHQLYFYIKYGLFSLFYCSMGLLSYQLFIKPIFINNFNKTTLYKLLLFISILGLSIFIDLIIGNQESTDVKQYLNNLIDFKKNIAMFNRALHSGPERSMLLVGLMKFAIFFISLGFFYLLVDSYYRKRELYIANRQSELFLLKSQINPHFLYNALNTIYGQAIKDRLDTFADLIQHMALQARKKVLKESDYKTVTYSENTILYIVSIAIGTLAFIHSLLISFFSSDPQKANFIAHTWVKMILNPQGALASAILFSIFTLVHFKKVFKPVWFTNLNRNTIFYKLPLYVLGLFILAVFYSIIMNIQNELNTWLIRTKSPYALPSLPGSDLKYVWEKEINVDFYVGIIRSVVVICVTSIIPYVITAIIYTSLMWISQSKNLEKQLKEQKKQESNSHLLTLLQGLLGIEGELKGTATEESLQQLISLMDYVQQTDGQTKVPIAEEIHFIDEYIRFQRKRLPTDADIDLQVEFPSYIPPKEIAPLVLIPFVENAFQYGIRTDAPCWICLKISVNEQELAMQLANTIVPKTILQEKSGIGLSNVSKRLELMYPAQHTLQIESDEQAFRVDLTIQLKNI